MITNELVEEWYQSFQDRDFVRFLLRVSRATRDRKISDESPLVYLVAPALRFHPTFATLARTIAPDIEIYRFDINEDWRSGVRVVRRERVNP